MKYPYLSILLKKVPIQALFSAFSLGILHNDNELTQIIISELKAYQFKEDYCADISYLTAHYCLVQVS